MKLSKSLMGNGLRSIVILTALIVSMTTVTYAAGKKFITIGTGDVGGTFYPVGSTIAKVINDNISGVRATVESTGGSIDNSRMVGTGELQLGMVMGSVAYSAQTGTGKFEGKKFPNLRILFATYPSISQWMALTSSNINSIYDLKGKRIAVGMAGSGSEVASKMILEAADITYDDVTPRYFGVAEGTAAVRDGQADAVQAMGGIPLGGYLNISETKSSVLIAIDNKIIDKIRKEKPYYYMAPIPANSYKGQPQDVQSIGVKCVVICSTEMSDEMAYDIAKAVWTHMDVMHSGHKSTEAMTKEFVASDLPIPLHPGAKKYWQEQGILK